MWLLPKEEILEIVADIYETHRICELGFNSIQLCRNMGYIVIPYSSLSNKMKAKFKSFDKDGFSFYNPKNKKCEIYYNDEISPSLRERFTIPHELGHIEMQHIFKSEITKEMNDDANEFARQLYAPQIILYKRQICSTEEIMSTFNVTERYANTLRLRLENRISDHGPVFSEAEKRILKTYEINELLGKKKGR